VRIVRKEMFVAIGGENGLRLPVVKQAEYDALVARLVAAEADKGEWEASARRWEASAIERLERAETAEMHLSSAETLLTGWLYSGAWEVDRLDKHTKDTEAWLSDNDSSEGFDLGEGS